MLSRNLRESGISTYIRLTLSEFGLSKVMALISNSNR